MSVECDLSLALKREPLVACPKGMLVELAGDAAEHCVQLGAEAAHDGDDGKGDAGGDQAVFNRRGTRLVFLQPSEKF